MKIRPNAHTTVNNKQKNKCKKNCSHILLSIQQQNTFI